MSILLPKFQPVTWLFLFAFYLLCLLEGGSNSGEAVFYALDPLTGAVIGGSALLGFMGASKADARAKEAMAAQKATERRQRRAIRKNLGPEAKRAKKRLKRGKYGLSKARQREGTEEINRAVEAQAKSQRAELERGEEGAGGSGRREQMKRALAQQRGDTVSKGRLGTARLSGELGQQQQAADRGTVSTYGRSLAGLSSAVPGMMLQTPSMGERMANLGQATLTSAATMGAFSGPADGLSKADKSAAAIAKGAAADPDAPKGPLAG